MGNRRRQLSSVLDVGTERKSLMKIASSFVRTCREGESKHYCALDPAEPAPFHSPFWDRLYRNTRWLKPDGSSGRFFTTTVAVVFAVVKLSTTAVSVAVAVIRLMTTAVAVAECLISSIPFALHIKNMRIFTIVPTATSAHYGTLHPCLVKTT
ncbi:hypothetical protein GWK47_009869 [Chionoecetes opilio]|uniref:Uncharacterized protein n=1 Tax=Chionoecetes opilio TaxID=41210 RepID=A0A8J4XWP5_CHIOP|nr:hypothetical protein GWK47_009869 [Chionoecetes opilio]